MKNLIFFHLICGLFTTTVVGLKNTSVASSKSADKHYSHDETGSLIFDGNVTSSDDSGRVFLDFKPRNMVEGNMHRTSIKVCINEPGGSCNEGLFICYASHLDSALKQPLQVKKQFHLSNLDGNQVAEACEKFATENETVHGISLRTVENGTIKIGTSFTSEEVTVQYNDNCFLINLGDTNFLRTTVSSARNKDKLLPVKPPLAELPDLANGWLLGETRTGLALLFLDFAGRKSARRWIGAVGRDDVKCEMTATSETLEPCQVYWKSIKPGMVNDKLWQVSYGFMPTTDTNETTMTKEDMDHFAKVYPLTHGAEVFRQELSASAAGTSIDLVPGGFFPEDASKSMPYPTVRDVPAGKNSLQMLQMDCAGKRYATGVVKFLEISYEEAIVRTCKGTWIERASAENHQDPVYHKFNMTVGYVVKDENNQSNSDYGLNRWREVFRKVFKYDGISGFTGHPEFDEKGRYHDGRVRNFVKAAARDDNMFEEPVECLFKVRLLGYSAGDDHKRYTKIYQLVLDCANGEHLFQTARVREYLHDANSTQDDEKHSNFGGPWPVQPCKLRW